MKLLSFTGKPIINRNTKTQLYTITVNNRIKNIKRELGIQSNSKEDVWNKIKLEVKSLNNINNGK